MALDKVARASCLSPTRTSARLDEVRRECCDHGLLSAQKSVEAGRGERGVEEGSKSGTEPPLNG